MVILIKDFTWRQTDSIVMVRVPLNGTSPSQVDLFTSEDFIKVHCPPYLFESCLHGKIEEEQSTCVISKGEAVFELQKKDPEDWPSLSKDVTKSEAFKIKQESLERARAKAQEDDKKKKAIKAEKQRQAVHEQIQIDTHSRKLVEQLKTDAKLKAMADLNIWEGDAKTTDIKNSFQSKRLISESESKVKSILPQEGGSIFDESDVEKGRIVPHHKMKPVKKVNQVPPPRDKGKIGINFTYRAFPTPGRESKFDEEQEWLRKQTIIQRQTGFIAEDLRPEENDPAWLLEKAKSFYDVGNHLAAISALTHAVQLNGSIPDLYVARSNSQLAIGNVRRVLKDTTKALELLQPHVDANAEMRFQCHFNRGQALLSLNYPKAAEADFVEALEIKPYDQRVHSWIEQAESTPKQEEQLPPLSYFEPEDLN